MSDAPTIEELRKRMREFEPEKPNVEPAILSIARPEQVTRSTSMLSSTRSRIIVGGVVPVFVFGTLCVMRPKFVTVMSYNDYGEPISVLAMKKVFGWTFVASVVILGITFIGFKMISSK